MKVNYSRNLLPIDHIHTYSFSFEGKHTMMEINAWMNRYWSLTLVLVPVYLGSIYFGTRFMQNRPKYNLRGLLFVWNVFLTTLYVTGLVRILPELIFMYQGGFHDMICLDCPYGCTKVSAFWGMIFVFLKVPELLDTAFIVLRKQQLYFLHWYHHCTVLVFTWYLYASMSSTGLLFAVINAIVHALMYLYYSLKALTIRVPLLVSMTLTIIQLSQMAIGCYANYYVYQVKQQGIHCSVSYTEIKVAFAIYISYLCLFSWYFYEVYTAKVTLMIASFMGKKIE